MNTAKAEKPLPTIPKGWQFSAGERSNFEVNVEESDRSNAKKCVSIKSLMMSEPRDIGNFSQECLATKYLGQRIRMSAWVKSDLSEGHGQLWLRIDGDWRLHCRVKGTFDNMWPDRLITGVTDWKQYSLVVEVPKTSTSMGFGIYNIGQGTVWIDEVSFEVVGKDVPLTGLLDDAVQDTEPRNLNFEEM
jgi:hypothetical protein